MLTHHPDPAGHDGRRRRPAIWLAQAATGPGADVGIGCLPRPRSQARAEDRLTRDALLGHVARRGGVAGPGPGLAHSGGLVACVSDAPCPTGLDIEWIRPRDVLSLAEFCYAPEEAQALRALPTDARGAAFVDRWVLKEAVAKRFGLDLMVALRRCIFEIDRGVITADLPTAAPWCARLFAPRPQVRLAWFHLDEGSGSLPFDHQEWRIGQADPRQVTWPQVAASGEAQR